VLGLSGCLLFTDSINKAPHVKIDEHGDPVIRGTLTAFTATVTDEDSQASLLVYWAEFKSKTQQGCTWVTPAAWEAHDTTAVLHVDVPYPFTAQSLDEVCLCARVTDHNGAAGQDCRDINPVPSTPVATIVDVSGDPSEKRRPLCSQIHLSAENSIFWPTDKIQFNWTIRYDGSDPSAKSVQLTDCAGMARVNTDQCFYAGSPGTYTVTLGLKATALVNGSSTSVDSNTDTFVIPVNEDTPPCIQRTDPSAYAQRILLSSGTAQGTAYQSRTFSVLNVKDDCESYPLPAGSTNSPTQFVWSVLDSTQASPTWTYQANTSNSFTVSQTQFSNARPGDTIGLRVEVRDTAVQKLYQSGARVCSINPPSESPALCCSGGTCGTPSDCVRWTTWTVEFLP